jgi:hypothetical protein
VRLLHRSHHLDRATRREARTAADGTYRIEGLVDGAYNVRAYSAGYQIWTRGRAFGVSPGAEVDFQARAIAGVTLEVLDPDGNLAREATITFTQETGFGGTTSSSERWSSANRTVYAQPGTWSVQAKSGDHGEMVSEPETVTLEAGGEPPTATLRLRGRPGIRGSIRFEDGIDDGQYFVTTVRVPRGVEAGPGLLLTAARSAGHSIWPEGGRFAITDLEPGLYVLGATRGGGEVATWCEVEVTEGLVERDLVIPAPDPSEYIVVHVLGPDGAPLSGVQFSSAFRSRHRSSSGGSQVARLDDGSWRVRHHAIDDDDRADEGGRFYVTASHPKLGSREVGYDAKTQRDLTITFEAPASLVVTVSGYGSSGYEDLLSVQLVGVEKNADTDDPVVGASSPARGGIDDEGRQSFGPLSPGDYEIRIHVRLPSHGSFSIVRVPISLGPGEAEKTVALPRLYTLTVLTDAPKASFRIQSEGDSRLSIWSLEAKDGKAVVRGVPAGTYLVQGQNGAEGQMRVRIPGQETVRFEGRPINALKVTITDPEGALARAGFRDGDVVVGVNGELFENQTDMQLKLMKALAGTAKLLVQRGGGRIEISVELGPLFRGRGEQGARMEPVAR